ncbi:MAG: PqqD family protein, partial [candidate division WOR-3 bacterium]|nr:PqqD family protein [candidate division WOR-3 bacterium]
MSDSKTASPLAAKTYRANEVVSCVDEGEDGAMLYNPDKDDTVMLNPTGRAIWSFLTDPRTLDDITGHLVAVYPGVAREQAVQDADKFIQSLL